MIYPKAKLILADGTSFTGFSFGYNSSVSGEVVFNTGMVGYPETLTDPSYRGQILVLTYPLIGNYGVPKKNVIKGLVQNFESEGIRIAGLVIADYAADYSHWSAQESLGQWLKRERIPAIFGVDTRSLTIKLRSQGTMLGKLRVKQDIQFHNSNDDDLVGQVSISRQTIYGQGKKTVLLVDLGVKHSIIRQLLSYRLKVIRVPYDYDYNQEKFDGIFLTNGPGDPMMCQAAIKQLQPWLKRQVPIMGICLGHQIIALAAGARTYKLKYGHRGQNQPCLEVGTKRCYITSQNHGYAVNEKSLPRDYRPWFRNLNDQTNEGLKHKTKAIFSVQFHPEANPGPLDTQWLFERFVAKL